MRLTGSFPVLALRPNHARRRQKWLTDFARDVARYIRTCVAQIILAAVLRRKRCVGLRRGILQQRSFEGANASSSRSLVKPSAPKSRSLISEPKAREVPFVHSFWRVCQLAALILPLALGDRVARAQENPLLDLLLGKQDSRLTASGIGIGIAGDVASYELIRRHGIPPTRIATPAFASFITSVGCVVAYPIVGTLVTQRSLTPREAYTGIAGCVIPFVGGWIVDKLLPHNAWYDGLAETRRADLRWQRSIKRHLARAPRLGTSHAATLEPGRRSTKCPIAP